MINESRMTDRARKIFRIAEKQTRLRGAPVVLPEYVLLALCLEGDGVAANVLRNLGAKAETIECQLPAFVQNATDSTDALAWNDGVLQAVEESHGEAKRLGHNYVGTEHLVLGIVHAGGGAVPAILARLNISPELVKREVYSVLGYEDFLTP